MDNLITITAASNHRHFYINGVNDRLILRYLKLTGGDVSTYNTDPDRDGGAVCIWTSGGKLNLYSSILINNKAKYGGAIKAYGDSSNRKKTSVNAYDSYFIKNEATLGGGGAFYLVYGVGLIINSTWTNNSAAIGGAGGIWWSDITFHNNNI